MLGRIIKHEIKASYKLIIILNVVMLITAIIGSFIFSIVANTDTPDDFTIFFSTSVSIMIYIFAILISVFGTQIYIAVRFYKSCFSHQGYLTFTLPLSPTQILNAKLFVGLIWTLVNFLLTAFSIFILTIPFLNETDFREFIALVANEFGFGTDAFSVIIRYILVIIIGGISSILMIYSSICFGQLLAKNKVLGAIASYAAISIILQTISTIVSFRTLFSVSTTLNSIDYFNSILDLSLILSIVLTIVLYILSVFIINKKLNLS